MNTAKLIWATPDADEHLAYIARVSNPENQDNPSIEGLLKYMMREGHVSPFDMVNVCIELNTTRDIGRQALRHYSIRPQEFCVAEGTLVTTIAEAGSIRKIAIEDLFKYQSDPRMQAVWGQGVRVFDLETKEFVRSKIVEVFSTGDKECFEVTLSDGKVLTCTAEHKLLTRTGFERLGDLSAGGLVAVNGQDLYRSYDWMAKAKASSLVKDGGITQIAAEAGCSYHTIRKWLKIHGLQFTKKESSIVAGGAWNKGLPSELQPMSGKVHSEHTRNLMAASSRKGVESNLFKNGTVRNDRELICDWQHKWRNFVHKRDGSVCVRCGSRDALELDHVLPVSSHPELATDINNLQLLCYDCHKAKSIPEMVASRQTVRWKTIVSIVSVGTKPTYDLEVEHPSHNYIANGLVTHNSQRYADVSSLGEFVTREFRLQDSKNRQASIPVEADSELAVEWELRQREVLELVKEHYKWCLSVGGAKEVARVILPEGLTPSRLYFNGSIRNWIFYLKSRLHESTQKEHRELAQAVLVELRKAAPISVGAFFPLEVV